MVHQLVEDFGIPIFEMDGYEADDVIGTIAQKAYNIEHKTKNEIEVVIVTGDRDILQLVNDRVRVFMPVKGLSEGKIYGEREVEEKFGIKPSQMIDYKALVGDPSDNYKGVAGIGPKTASDLLKQFQTLDKLYEHLDKIQNKKISQRLSAGRKEAGMSKTLATIVTDVPINVNLALCRLPELDKPNIHHVFERYGFRSLIPRLSGNINNITYNIEHITENRKPASPTDRLKADKKNQTENNLQQTTLF